MAELKEIKFVSPEKLGYYDSKAKARMEAADEALRAALQANITAEETRAKAAELANSQAAQAAQTAADNAQAHSEALAAKVGEVPTDKTVMGIITEMQENAYDDTALRTELDGKLALKADKEQVAKDITDAVKVETDARVEAVAGVQGAVDALAGTHATDKAALEGAIALKADKTALEAEAETARAAEEANAAAIKAIADDYLKAADKEALEAEDARIEGLVTAEAERAAGVEADHKTRIEKMEAFFEGAASDEGEGENLKNALDTLVEIQTYIDGDGAAADAMVKDIAANKKAIEDHIATDHDFGAADAALKAELNAEIAKKADATVVEAMDEAYKAADTALSGRIDALEAIDHEHANKELLDTYTQTEADLADAVAKKHAHANAEELAKIADGDVAKWNAAEQNAKDYADGLNTAMDERMTAAEGDIDNLQASLAEGGATALAIAAAKKAGDDAQAEVDALEEVVETKAAAADVTALAGRVEAEEGKSADHEERIAALEEVKHVEISFAEIDAMFEEAQA